MSQTMPRIMTIEEMEAEFDSEWVLINEPEVQENLLIIRGEVIWHGKDRDELDKKIREMPGPFSLAVWYTGVTQGEVAISIYSVKYGVE